MIIPEKEEKLSYIFFDNHYCRIFVTFKKQVAASLREDGHDIMEIPKSKYLDTKKYMKSKGHENISERRDMLEYYVYCKEELEKVWWELWNIG